MVLLVKMVCWLVLLVFIVYVDLGEEEEGGGKGEGSDFFF